MPARSSHGTPDIIADRPVNGINAEGPKKYVRLVFDGGLRRTLLLLLELFRDGLPLCEWTEEGRFEEGEGGALSIAPVRARRCG